MQNSKKILFSFFVWLIAVVLILGAIIGPFMYSESHYGGQKSYEGQIDTLILGASQSQQAFIPSVINEKLNVKSYNMSSVAMTFHGREEILIAEQKRNPIKRVIIEIAADAMLLEAEDLEGDMCLLPKFSGLKNKIGFMGKHFGINDLEKLLAYYMIEGLNSYKKILSHDYISSDYGFVREPSKDITTDENSIPKELNSNSFDVKKMTKQKYEELTHLLKYCASNFEETYVVVVPVSDLFIWKNNNFDDVLKVLKDACDEFGVAYADFNLLRTRYEVYSDKTCYLNENHLSENGAEIFTDEFVKYFDEIKQNKLSELSYNNYNELKADSPYSR